MKKAVGGVKNAVEDVASGVGDTIGQAGKGIGDVFQGNFGEAGKHFGKAALEAQGVAAGPLGEFATERLEDAIFNKKSPGMGKSAPTPENTGIQAEPGNADAIEKIWATKSNSVIELENLPEIISDLSGETDYEINDASTGSSDRMADIGSIDDGLTSKFEKKLDDKPKKAAKYLAKEASPMELMEVSKEHPGKFAEAMTEASEGVKQQLKNKMNQANRTIELLSNMFQMQHQTSKSVVQNMRV